MQFSVGIRHAVKTCRFFPKLADVFEGVAAYRANPTPPRQTTAPQIEAHTATPDNLTAEEIKRNRERVRLIAKALAGRLSWDEAERTVAQMGHINEFSTMNPAEKNQGGIQ